MSGTNPLMIGVVLVVALTIATIVVNATMLQDGRHPAPLFPESLLSLAPQVTGQHTGSVRKDATGTERPKVPAESALVADLQQALIERGQFSGPADGRVTPLTVAAIRKFQQTNGMTVDGRISADLLARVQLTSSEAVPVPRASPFSPPARRERVRQSRLQDIQEALSKLGYGPVRADGVMGEETAGAIRRFELDRGMMITGQVNKALVNELIRIGGM